MFANYKVIEELKDSKLSLEKLRGIDRNVTNLADEELSKLRQHYYDLAQLMFENWYEDKISSKNPTGSLTENN